VHAFVTKVSKECHKARLAGAKYCDFYLGITSSTHTDGSPIDADKTPFQHGLKQNNLYSEIPSNPVCSMRLALVSTRRDFGLGVSVIARAV
jgi:hypothetical protein